MTTAGWLVTGLGWLAIEVSTGGMPVTTPREFVSVVKEVWGKGSADEEESYGSHVRTTRLGIVATQAVERT